jgi:hypothetical protein
VVPAINCLHQTARAGDAHRVAIEARLDRHHREQQYRRDRMAVGFGQHGTRDLHRFHRCNAELRT